MLWSLPDPIGSRGAGLGNEIFPWAKAYLGSKALGIRLVDPPWRLNTRRYDREFGSKFLDTPRYAAIRMLPQSVIGRASFLSLHEPDYFKAMVLLRPSLLKERRVSVLHSSGMTGGYLGIRRARAFLKRQILCSNSALSAIERVVSLDEGPTVRIGIHLRGGDFDEVQSVQPGVFNTQLPLKWYEDTISSLRSALELDSRVYLATDSPTPSMLNALSFGGRTPQLLATDSLGDLAVLSECDIVISSVSSFSMLAIFLSDAPYVWHADQLGEHNGWLSIWGHEAQDEGGGQTRAAESNQSSEAFHVRRGLAQGSRAVWTDSLLNQLQYRALSRRLSDDLIYYGVTEARPKL